ncbi:FAD-dependent monooxygenase [Alteromonas gilva]|uniref:FAD-dependent monooxygenase n=1 Tax=Alteromonas gilva TaxID=2987522 RepID=A0ABT5KZL0_9ALTE|nr:FAD-dependent monooxygenase [Alteromonas gilva]MDC8830209.1 FAD-dependent monooxygenase [Alteromonas gilva]
MYQADVAIVGAGIVGLALARALKDTPLSVVVLDSSPITKPLSEQPELRVSAINAANQAVLQDLGVWSELDSERLSCYRQMQVWDQDSFGRIEFSSEEMGTSELGHIIENQSLVNALYSQVSAQQNVQVLAATQISKVLSGQAETMLMLDNDDVVSCRLLVGADGANSAIRKYGKFPLTFKDYEHTAIVATIHTEQPHAHIARQVFTPDGPLALLPLSDPHLCSIVWSQNRERADALLGLSNNDFANALRVAIDGDVGGITVQSARMHFPLTMRYARQWLSDGLVIIGDAAHTIHPLAGQGANLGLQDAFALAECLSDLCAAQTAFYEARHLRPFERARKAEAMKMIAAMEGFKQLFAGNNRLKKLIRGVGMCTADAIPGVKQRFITQAMGW